MKIKERALSLLLSLVMVLTFMPTLAFAEGDEAPAADNAPVVEEPIVEEPVSEEPIIEEPTVEEPATQNLVEVSNENVKKDAAKDGESWVERVTSITFTPAGPSDRFSFISDYDLGTVYNQKWDDEEKEWKDYTYNGYNYWFWQGDKIVATLDGGSTKTLVYTYIESLDDYEWYIQEDESFLAEDENHPYFDDDQYKTPWTPGGDNYFWVALGYFDADNDTWVEVTTSKTATKATVTELSPLERAKNDAYDELDTLIGAKYDSCRDAQKQELERIYCDADEAIYFAESVEEVNAAMATARSAIAAVKTDAQLRAEEEAARIRAIEAARQGTLDGSLPALKASKPKAAKKAITVKWKKLKKKQLKTGVTGIQVWVCSDGAFANGSTIERVAGKKKASLKIKGLQKGVTYYIKVRTVGPNGYGPWSAVKTVKVKK